MIVTDRQVKNAHDVGMVNVRDQFVFPQKTVESAKAVRPLGIVPQHLQDHVLLRAFLSREINAGMLARGEAALQMISLDQWIDPGPHIANEQRGC